MGDRAGQGWERCGDGQAWVCGPAGVSVSSDVSGGQQVCMRVHVYVMSMCQSECVGGFSLWVRKEDGPVLINCTVDSAGMASAQCPIVYLSASQASDPDTGEGGRITYSLLPGNG